MSKETASLIPTAPAKLTGTKLVWQLGVGAVMLLLSIGLLVRHEKIYLIANAENAFVDISLFKSLLSSVARVLLATAGALLTALGFGFVVFAHRISSKSLVGISLLLSATPPLLWSISAVMAVGLSWWNPPLVVYLSLVFLLSSVLIDLFSKTPSQILELVAQHSPSVRFQFRYILIRENERAILFFSRVALVFAWIPLLSAESLGIQYGLGNVLLLGRQLHSWMTILGVWLAFISIALFLDAGIQLIWPWRAVAAVRDDA